MIFASKKENTYQYFVDLIDQNIHLFGEAVREKLELAEHEKLTDDEFVECYVDGMSRMVGQIYENAGETLRADAKCYARFCDAIKHPERYGFRFQNKNITIGKVYLCYMLGKTRKRAPKADCIKLERYAVRNRTVNCIPIKKNNQSSMGGDYKKEYVLDKKAVRIRRCGQFFNSKK